VSPRPRTVSDEDILAATAAAIGRLGPSRFTLADVAGEVGLSAATLVQRFGSKRGLLLALASGAAASTDAGFAALRARHRSPSAALVSAATHMAGMAASPEELANHLAFLQIDLSDPEFHALALAQARSLRAGYRRLVEEAVAAGELVPCDAGRLARLVEAAAGGSLIAWAIHREGDARAFVRADVEALLAPYRATRKRKAR
jgi:AcrR family transcriptional regulator